MGVRRSGKRPCLATALSIAAGVLIVAGVAGEAQPVMAQTVSNEGAKKDPAEARKDVISGVKAYEKGKMDEAIALLSKGLKSGGLPSADTAKALYYRGLANRRSGRPAQAISDLTSSVWLKDGLSEEERKSALENRSAAYAEAGLKDPGIGDIRVGGGAGGSQAAAGSGAPSGSSTATSTYSTSANSGGTFSGVGNFFSGLFGGGSSASASTSDNEEAAAAAAPASGSSGLETASTQPAASPQPAAAASVSAWNSETHAAQKSAPAQVSQDWSTSARPVTRTAAVPPAAPAKPKTSAAKGRYEVQVAAVRSRDEAERLAHDIMQQHGNVLGSRVAEVQETVFGNMGTFYKVSVGPFASANDTAGVCKALKAGGYDCMVAKN